MTRLIIILFAAVLFMSSCRSARNIQTAISKKDTVAVTPVPVIPSADPHNDSVVFMRDIYQQVINKHISFTTFSGKIELDYTDGDGKNFDATAHIRMYKDSVIWISITGMLGIEGVRAYITRDSVKVLNKQDKVYIARSVSFLQEVTALPLGLASLQDLLVGNPVFLDSNIISYRLSPDAVSLQSNGEFFKNLLTVGLENKLVKSSKLDDLDEMRSRTCYLEYDDYETKGGLSFPARRKISVTEKKKLEISLEYKQYEFNETLSFPFSVPKNYKRE